MIDGVPPYSNLIINLELISWRSVIDVMGDEKILKKVMKLGKGFDRPSEGSLAKGNSSKEIHIKNKYIYFWPEVFCF